MSLFEKDHKQCLEKLIWATNRLQVQVSQSQLEKIADLIVETMTGRWRLFHTPEHIFQVGGTENAIEVLAALFHDVVYVQVDQSVNFNLSYYIAPCIKEYREQLFIRDSSELPKDLILEIVMDIFGFVPGQGMLPMSGQNEFLSAVVAGKVLEPFLSPELIVQIITCIEATIPFRGKSESGLTASEQLYQRLQDVNQKFNLGLTELEIIESVKSAVILSNRDVGSFAHPLAARFLDGTWNLLPETNHNLHNSSSYTVSEYRIALQKMEGFMNFLNPKIIFQQFQEEPDNKSYQALLDRANKNLEIGRLYLGSKLFTMGFLEAFSLRLGRDIAISSMMGELPSSEEGISTDNLIDIIPKIPNKYHLKNEIEKEVLDLLEHGRYQSSSYDLKNSPLATFMVKYIGFDEIRYQCNRAKDFFKGKLSGEDFLAGCNPEITETITEGIVELFEKRKAALSRY
ncbi:MAG: hypothetical protein F6K10_08230 [Moorea sp. SIO2B7]|nr:hypothetical protein [Moorena sp. SIO2B7]